MRGGSLAPHAHLTEQRTHGMHNSAPSHAPRRADLGALFRSRIEHARVEREGVQGLRAHQAGSVPNGVEAMVKKYFDQMPASAGEGASEGVSGRCPRGWWVRGVCSCALEL